MDVDLEVRAAADLRIVDVDPRSVTMMSQLWERLPNGLAWPGTVAVSVREKREPGAALAADRKVGLVVDEAAGAHVDPARRGHELLGRRVDQLAPGPRPGAASRAAATAASARRRCGERFTAPSPDSGPGCGRLVRRSGSGC